MRPYAKTIDEIAVWVDDAHVEVTYTYGQEQALNTEGPPIVFTFPCWAHFDVTFPPDQDMTVKVVYRAPAYSRDEALGQGESTYVIGIGAGWKDTIGKALIVACFPYEVNELNLLSCQPEDCQVAGKEISWRDENSASLKG